MTLEQFWMIVIRQWKFIVTCFVVVGLATFIISKLMTPVYQSTALVQVTIHSQNNSADINSLLASDQLVQTESQLALSDPVLREVASHYPGITAEQLAGTVTATPRASTQLFEITVSDSNPAQAAEIANDIAATLIKQQQQVIQQENNQSQQQLQQDLSKTRQQMNTLTAQIATLKSGGGDSSKIATLQLQLNGLQQHYTQWQTVLAQLELAQAQDGSFLRVAQAAQPAFKPSRPNVLLNSAVGLMAGLFLGILLAVLYEQLDTRVRTPEQLTQLLNWTVLGTVWRARSSRQEEMINPQGRDANVESYRILRTNVGFSAVDKSLQTLVVTSTMPGDGKSTVAANLAIFMAKAGKNTLLIDADLRRPTQHLKFRLSPDRMGLSNAILNLGMSPAGIMHSDPQVNTNALPGQRLSESGTPSFSIEPFIHAVGIPNLRVMPSGPLPPNPSELLESRAMKRLLQLLTNCGAEIVILDAPPIRGLSDASILASKVDGTLVVVDVSRAHKGHLKEVKAQLTQVGAHIVGCVVNKQRLTRQDSSYSYYYRHDEQESEGAQLAHTPQPPVVPAHVSLPGRVRTK